MLFVELVRAFHRRHVEFDAEARLLRHLDSAADDLQRLLGGVQALMRANESPVARALQASLRLAF